MSLLLLLLLLVTPHSLLPQNGAVHLNNSPFSCSLYRCYGPAVPGSFFLCVCSVTMVMKLSPERLVCVLRGSVFGGPSGAVAADSHVPQDCVCLLVEVWSLPTERVYQRMCKRALRHFLPFLVYFLKCIVANVCFGQGHWHGAMFSPSSGSNLCRRKCRHLNPCQLFLMITLLGLL